MEKIEQWNVARVEGSREQELDGVLRNEPAVAEDQVEEGLEMLFGEAIGDGRVEETKVLLQDGLKRRGAGVSESDLERDLFSVSA